MALGMDGRHISGSMQKYIINIALHPPKTNMSPKKGITSIGKQSSSHGFSGDMYLTTSPQHPPKPGRDILSRQVADPPTCGQRNQGAHLDIGHKSCLGWCRLFILSPQRGQKLHRKTSRSTWKFEVIHAQSNCDLGPGLGLFFYHVLWHPQSEPRNCPVTACL